MMIGAIKEIIQVLYRDMKYYNPERARYLIIITTVLGICTVILIGSIIAGIIGVIGGLFAPANTYIGQIKKIQVEQDQAHLTIEALAGEKKESLFDKLISENKSAWTNVKYPEEIQGKLENYFKRTFTLKLDAELKYEVDDKVKVIAKKNKIKDITKANEHDIENATIPVVTGVVKMYEKNNKNEYIVSINVKEPDILNVRKGSVVELYFTQEQFEEKGIKVGEPIKIITR